MDLCFLALEVQQWIDWFLRVDEPSENGVYAQHHIFFWAIGVLIARD